MPAIDPTALEESLKRLEDAYGHAEHEPSDLLQGIVDGAQALFGLSGAGLLLIDADEVLRYVAASNDAIRVLEVVQEELGEGPCVDTFVYDTVIRSHDLSAEDRWPAVVRRVVPEGIRAVLGVPVHLGGGCVGSLNVYLDIPRRWDDSEVEALQAYSTMIEMMLATVLTARRHSQLAEQLQYALDNRVVIERSIGYLMGSHSVDAITAFELLRKTARADRRKVAAVAEDILARRLNP